MPFKLGTVEASLRYITIIIGRSAVGLYECSQCERSVRTAQVVKSHTDFPFFQLLLLLLQYAAC